MSWLSSVNNLLENLDGQAETVAETVAEQANSTGISSNLRRLNNTIASNASAITSNIANSASKTLATKDDNFDDDDDEDYYDDDDSAYFDDDDFGDDEEFTTDEDDHDSQLASIINANAKTGNISNPPFVSPPAKSAPALELVQPTNNQPPDKPVSEKADDVDRQQTIAAKPSAVPVAMKSIEPKKLDTILHQTPSKPTETSSATIVPTNQQISTPYFTPQQQSSKISKISKDEAIPVSTEEKKKDALSGDNADDHPELKLTETVSSPTAIAASTTDTKGDVGSSAAPSAVAKLPPSRRKASGGQNAGESAKVVKNPHLEKTLHSSNKNKPGISRKAQTTGSVPNRPPPAQKKVAPKPSSEIPASIPNNNPTANQSGEKLQEQKLKQQQNEMKLLLQKKQQQHQQVLLSKNKTIQSLESQLVKLREEVTKGAAEHEKLNQRTKDLGEKLQESEREIEAQANELLKAGEEMEKIRKNAKEEREDLLDDHEDEMEDIQRNHQEALDKMRQDYEKTIAEWKERFESEESLRQREGGDSILELQEANKREREALKKLAEVTEERTALQTKLDQVVGHETTLKQQVESSLESAETVAAREQRARDELDEAAAMHAKQMAQRQRREAELEQTILEMGSALTLAKQQLQQQSASSPEGETGVVSGESNEQQINGSYYKEQFEQVAEELESVRVSFTMETQRREALQQELTEVSKEREQELSLAQSRQHQHDLKVTDLESTIHKLQASIRASQQQPNHSSDGSGRNDDGSSNAQYNDDAHQRALFTQELEVAKQEITKLSEQLFRQQVLAKNAKSEILALKGRLQAANTRADDAEKAQYNNSKYTRSRSYDVEGGSANNAAPAFSARRRVKGGSSRGVRSIRSALPCFGSGRPSAGSGGPMDQIALTIDAIDSWMVDTGSFMRHEPFARLGLLLYLLILHLWTFALVAFHTTEVEHGDFGSMDSNPRHWREHT